MCWSEVVMAARRGEGPLRHARAIWRATLRFRLPMIRPLWGTLYAERELRLERWWPLMMQLLYREPLLRYRCTSLGRGVTIDAAIPQIYGDGKIYVGADCVLGGRNTWLVGFPWGGDAELVIGDRVVVGYQTTLSVATRLLIGDDTIMAPNVQIYDNPSHPLSPARRLRHEGLRADECAPVTIGKNAWIGSNSIIMRGVTIGDNSVVAAGAIVTRDVPPNTLVGGNPAKPIKEISD
jgi:acetyltransferase-like isoleucine patch superfamily enzyme